MRTLPLRLRVEPRDEREEGRLAGAVRPEQRDEAALRHGQRDVGERLARAEPVADAVERRRLAAAGAARSVD